MALVENTSGALLERLGPRARALGSPRMILALGGDRQLSFLRLKPTVCATPSCLPQLIYTLRA